MNLSLCSFYADDHCHLNSCICRLLLSGPLVMFSLLLLFSSALSIWFLLHSILPGFLECHLKCFQQHFSRPLQ